MDGMESSDELCILTTVCGGLRLYENSACLENKHTPAA